jgi:hypothetical protein
MDRRFSNATSSLASAALKFCTELANYWRTVLADRLSACRARTNTTLQIIDSPKFGFLALNHFRLIQDRPCASVAKVVGKASATTLLTIGGPSLAAKARLSLAASWALIPDQPRLTCERRNPHHLGHDGFASRTGKAAF